MGLKFDIVVGNPPYLRGLHMEFLYAVFDALSPSGRLCFVQPATEFIKQGKGIRRGKLSALLPSVTALQLLNPSSVFPGAKFSAPICVVQLRKDKHIDGLHFTIDGKSADVSFKDVSIHTLKPGYLAFKNQASGVWGAARSIADVALNSLEACDDDGFYVQLPGFGGNTETSPRAGSQGTLDEFFLYDFAVLLGKNHCIVKRRHELSVSGGGKLAGHALRFDTKQEAESCISFLRTNFARANLFVYKYNLHIYKDQLCTIPVVPWDRTWTDVEVTRVLAVPQECLQFVDTLPEYYDAV